MILPIGAIPPRKFGPPAGAMADCSGFSASDGPRHETPNRSRGVQKTGRPARKRSLSHRGGPSTWLADCLGVDYERRREKDRRRMLSPRNVQNGAPRAGAIRIAGAAREGSSVDRRTSVTGPSPTAGTFAAGLSGAARAHEAAGVYEASSLDRWPRGNPGSRTPAIDARRASCGWKRQHRKSADVPRSRRAAARRGAPKDAHLNVRTRWLF